eukprot:CAMPEP_0119259648 /NCGR_PEP_ID=MMETSP1329-20130426/381_1 /TAXON_ID=114041 /ORGANISM="Genus nov. species nov., Strain RCC1024" /LENGTH=309 /DNA_ID=CAMNT_0007259041 /DNA_START=141 /DNA_END=1070 /DNA_ORIENTATION=+
MQLAALALVALALPAHAKKGKQGKKMSQPEAPDGPSQQCRDDAGPPWGDDAEHFPGKRYHDGTPAVAEGACPPALAAACADKGKKAAYLDGPLDCGGKGWFCRIMPQAGWANPDFGDVNFAHCNASDADERDDDGHCHGSDADDAYGWWIRDHWFRGYAGRLTCACDWGALEGLANRCDFRRHVNQGSDLENCRDANEEKEDGSRLEGYEDGCEAHEDTPFVDPCEDDPDSCWTVTSFADPESVGGEGGDEDEDEGDCEDDEDWRRAKNGKKKKKQDCGWVAKKRTSKRCKTKDKYGVKAKDACECACK